MAAIKSASEGRRQKGSIPQELSAACFLRALLRHAHSIALDPILFQKHSLSLGRETDLRLCADGAGPVEPDSAGAFLDIKIG